MGRSVGRSESQSMSHLAMHLIRVKGNRKLSVIFPI